MRLTYTIAQIEKPNTPTQVLTINTEMLIAISIGIFVTVVSGLLKRSIDINDKRISDLETESARAKAETVKVMIDIVEMKGDCLKRDDIHRVEAMIASLHRRIDEFLMDKRNA